MDSSSSAKMSRTSPSINRLATPTESLTGRSVGKWSTVIVPLAGTDCCVRPDGSPRWAPLPPRINPLRGRRSTPFSAAISPRVAGGQPGTGGNQPRPPRQPTPLPAAIHPGPTGEQLQPWWGSNPLPAGFNPTMVGINPGPNGDQIQPWWRSIPVPRGVQLQPWWG